MLGEAGYPHEIVNAGESSGTSAGGLRRLEWSLDGDVRVLVLALGRTPTLGEIGEAEEALRERLARGASVAASIVHDPSLGERVLAAVFCVPQAGTMADGVFPSEDPATLEVPAFVRRRSAGLCRRRGRIRRSA